MRTPHALVPPPSRAVAIATARLSLRGGEWLHGFAMPIYPLTRTAGKGGPASLASPLRSGFHAGVEGALLVGRGSSVCPDRSHVPHSSTMNPLDDDERTRRRP